MALLEGKMGPLARLMLLPATLLVLVSEVAANNPAPTAIRKQLPGSHDKLFPEHLAFAQIPRLSPLEAAEAARIFLDEQDGDSLGFNITSRRHRPAFALHHEESEASTLRRAAEALSLLQKRSACPAGMNSCSEMGSPNKCCQEGTYCTDVPDTTVGHVACCPNGANCGGGIGKCPSDATSCPSELGGGCCIPGYVCQGIGCVPSALATPIPTTKTTIETSIAEPTTETITATQTTFIGGSPSTVIVTLTVTRTTPMEPITRTETEIVTATGTATGAPPWRPTAITSEEDTPTSYEETQTGCPTAFYGCLARHGGGCCQTDRNCDTHSCPSTPTTIITNGVTIVVPASNVPASTTSTCAGGWFMCGKDAGPVAGCCPSGYSCGTASCYTVEASQTGRVQKEFPKKESSAGQHPSQLLAVFGVVGACLLSLLI